MKIFSYVLFCLLAICLTTPSFGQSTPSFGQSEQLSDNNDKPVNRKENTVQVSRERKQQLLSFVDANHPELKELLSKLENGKAKRPYRQAITSLDKSVKKLEGIKQRSPKRYETALQQWKIESRIKVAGAQVKLNDTEESRKKLESLVTQLIDFHIQRMKNEREQIQQRLKQMEAKIADAESNREQAIEKRVKSATRRGKKKAKNKE